ncbi:diacetyl reductase [(S)-acetoin forming] [Colletotrichum liriopes]|uniref:Diacetyl reductase [(S)-acetoin forming] n=1 Tax=Colletotrichum liriopes TaxID=708192 RepID=A0AA37GPI4_9PEZI|nr:diacetyl reductase [(S)-acetoin forming] [Colletotrichum liriopes]
MSAFVGATRAAAQASRVAIVTGSARGIGRAIALRIARDGYDVCINDIAANEAGAHRVAQEIRDLGRKSVVATADVRNLVEVQGMVRKAVDELGPLNTMLVSGREIANAGIAQVKPLLDITEGEFENMFRVNVFGVQHCYQTAAKQMIEQGNCKPEQPGKIIGCSSIVGFKPFALLSHYSASKWAVRGLTQASAMEYAEHNITVNAYAPGIVGTAMWDLIDEKLGERTGAKKGDTIKKFTSELIAQKRTSVPEDVAKLVSFLAGPDSDHVTGQTQIVDGGIIYT